MEFEIIYETTKGIIRKTGPFTEEKDALRFMKAYKIPTVRRAVIRKDRKETIYGWKNPNFVKKEV